MGLEEFSVGVEQESNNTETNEGERKKYNPSTEKIDEFKKQESKVRQEEMKEADRLVADVNFDMEEGEKVDSGRLNFHLADISGYIDIDNDVLLINGKEYDIKLPKGADLSSIKLDKNKLIIEGKVGFFSGDGEVSLDTFREQILELYKGEGKITVNTENGELTVASKGEIL